VSEMSAAEQDQIRSMAERIARRLSSGAAGGEEHTQRDDDMSATNGDDVAALRASLLDIQQRLTHIEAHLTHDHTGAPAAQKDGGESMLRHNNTGITAQTEQTNHTSTTPTRSPWLSGTYVPATAHPSGEHFQIGEAVSELVDYFEREKICSLEPGEKPCDNCGMCSARGF